MNLNFLKGKFNKKDLLAVLVIAVVPVLIENIRDLFYQVGPVLEPNLRIVYACMGFLYSLIITSSLYFGCLTVFHFMNEKFPWNEKPVKRLVIQFFLLFSYATFVQFVVLLLFSLSPLYSDINTDSKFFFENIFFGNTITLIVSILVEGVYFFRRWKESLLLAERMKRENLVSQLNSLKTQLDPHFLFNSLNVLSTLIKKDPEKAEQFIADFAKVYRYVLDVKDEMVVTLSSELKFLESYTALQKIRFGDALQLKVNINPRPMTLYLPPLCLQELVSNAVKHNEVSKEKPLVVEIFNKGDILVVRNNLQRRNEPENSTQLGLENIRKRYSLLSGQKPMFEIREESFVVELPLLEIESE